MVIDNYYFVNGFSLTMFNVCNFKLWYGFKNTDSCTQPHKGSGKGASKQMIKCITIFLCYKSFIDPLLTNTLYSKYFECLFFCVAAMPATNLTISGLICYNVKLISMYNFMGQTNWFWFWVWVLCL